VTAILETETRRAVAALSAFIRRFGLLGLLSVVALAVALWVQHAAHLPRHYTWESPYRVLLYQVIGGRRLPCALLGVTLLGALSVIPLATIRARVRQPVTRKEQLGALLALAAASLIGWADASFFFDHDLWDGFSMGLFVVFAVLRAQREASKRNALRALGTLAYGAAVFVVICFFYTVIKATVFQHAEPIDETIVAIETFLFGAPPHRALAIWAQDHFGFVEWCDWTYFRLFDHMLLTGVLLWVRRDTAERTEYLGALAFCYLLGGPLYHLFPGVGPGYFEPQYFPYLGQFKLVTPVVRAALWHNTQDAIHGTGKALYTWSYVACMPSLHVAHELVMAFYARKPWPALALSVAFTLMTLISVVVMGWHYPLDWLGGLAVAVIAIKLSRKLRGWLLPSALS